MLKQIQTFLLENGLTSVIDLRLLNVAFEAA